MNCPEWEGVSRRLHSLLWLAPPQPRDHRDVFPTSARLGKDAQRLESKTAIAALRVTCPGILWFIVFHIFAGVICH
jgi:hypothetical protein